MAPPPPPPPPPPYSSAANASRAPPPPPPPPPTASPPTTAAPSAPPPPPPPPSAPAPPAAPSAVAAPPPPPPPPPAFNNNGSNPLKSTPPPPPAPAHPAPPTADAASAQPSDHAQQQHVPDVIQVHSVAKPALSSDQKAPSDHASPPHDEHRNEEQQQHTPAQTESTHPPDQQQQQQQVSDSADGAMPKAKGNAPFVHNTYEKNQEEDEVMVKTEFVWADGAENDVQLSGSWNGWMTIQMYHEGGGMWSVVTPVPAGIHEFKFVVDGEWRHSTRHPTVGEDEATMNNVRMIRGPPRNKKRADDPANRPAQDTPPDGNPKGCCIIA